MQMHLRMVLHHFAVSRCPSDRSNAPSPIADFRASRSFEVAHSCFNRFRKRLVRYEKLERSFLALNHLAAIIIVFRKIRLAVNIVYG